ncbi:DUF6082 family protein [Streptomyces sp. NBC_01381]|uniref:DUF6082 family protein n=1 Tax=Streptomyces sp. NBC_01381 TaxID=2903845 RepID=UPI00225BA1F9|nr:DUF6082 family protein [Streptomyces sp. NBC_01381]MCX4666921.1 DUF6082 family protein [Streptomyces sp. NBC_01381]
MTLVQVPVLQGDRSSNAGQAFGAAAAASSTVLLFYMARTMRMQEKESEMQRIVLQNQQRVMEEHCGETRMMKGEIHRTSEALVRGLHIAILRDAMSDADLAATWPTLTGDLPQEKRKQYLYINQVLSLQYLAFEVGDYSEAAIEAVLQALFTVPVWREFWERIHDRNRVPGDSAEARFAVIAERAYQAAGSTTPLRRQA